MSTVATEKSGTVAYPIVVNNTSVNNGDACFALNKRSCMVMDDGTVPPVCTAFHSTILQQKTTCQNWCNDNPAACDAAKTKFCTENPMRPECGCISAEKTILPDGTNWYQYNEYMNSGVITNMLATNSPQRSCWWNPCVAGRQSFKLSTEPACPSTPNICISRGGTMNCSQTTKNNYIQQQSADFDADGQVAQVANTNDSTNTTVNSSSSSSLSSTDIVVAVVAGVFVVVVGGYGCYRLYKNRQHASEYEQKYRGNKNYSDDF
eukprot:GILJ01012303.1.p2 GENE.GILJ01012303.1~~GILJ01012303.1.p2  ORF type:complete len:273 (-),score=35.64 GILJ01012303.1:1117-1905(-)